MNFEVGRLMNQQYGMISGGCNMPAKCPECHFDLSKGKVVPEKLFAEIKCPNCGYIFNPTTLSDRKLGDDRLLKFFYKGDINNDTIKTKKGE